jgi:hypothetical protein
MSCDLEAGGIEGLLLRYCVAALLHWSVRHQDGVGACVKGVEMERRMKRRRTMWKCGNGEIGL